MQTNPIDPSNTTLNPTLNALSPAASAGAPAMLPTHFAAPIGGPHHRRARSEFALRIPEDFGMSSGDPMATGSFEEMGSEDDLFSTFLDIEKIGCKLEGSGSGGSEDGVGRDRVGESSGEGKERRRMGNVHRHSNSVDGSSSVSSKGEVVFGDMLEAKKAMTAEQLAELAAVDPKRAKRILANRQSAARSKERKARYISELERRVQTLQTEATTLSAQLTLYQRDTTGLTAENAELKLRLQTMEQQAQSRDALNEALNHEVERLKIATGETSSTGEANEVVLNPLPFNPSFFPIPQPQASFSHQTIQLPTTFHQPQLLTTTNHSLLSYSHPLSDIISHDHLGRLQRLDISKGSLIVKSESSSISASESSSNF